MGLIISGTISYHLFKNLDSNNPPLKFEFLITVISFGFSLLWVWFSANNLISLITTLGDLLNIPSTFFRNNCFGFWKLYFRQCFKSIVS